MFSELDDTIVAVSSPAGSGLRGILRLSGPDALRLADEVFRPTAGSALSDRPGYRRIFGTVRVHEIGELPAEAYLFRAPASYTRQDIVELHTPGAAPVLSALLESLIARGARHAEPGEFTARAYFHGALDLTNVEGVAAVIHARTDAQLRASEALLHGRLSRRSAELRDELADLLALVEAEIDFVEEAIRFVSLEEIARTSTRIAAELEDLLERAPAAERLEMLPEAILIGRPNAGKSTLFNRLCGMDRAIRSAVAGTTRDVLAAPVNVPGGELVLMDTAGLDESAAVIDSPAQHPTQLAQEATRRSQRTADLIVLVVDAGDDPTGTIDSLMRDLPSRAVLIAVNKADTLDLGFAAKLVAELHATREREDVIAISALTGEGVEALRVRIGQRLFGDAQPHATDMLALSERQRSAMHSARLALRRACDLCTDSAAQPELIAIEVREAMHALSLLVGEVATDELLARIFSRFCIGK